MGLREVILRDRPIGFWFLDGAPPYRNLGSDASTLANSGSGQSTNTASLVTADDLRSMTFTTSSFLTGPSGAPYSPEAGASGLLTLEIVLEPTGSITNAEMLFTKGSGSNYEYDLQLLTGGAVQWSVYTTAGVAVASVTSATGVATVGKAMHILGTYDRANALMILYINGNEVGRSTTFSGNATAAAAAIEIGKRADAAGTQFQGLISVLALYGTALSPSRVKEHGRAFLGLYPRLPRTDLRIP